MLPFRWLFRNTLRVFAVFFLSLLFGMAIWWGSPTLTGQLEPWDAEGWEYIKLLFAAGFVSSLFAPRAFWVAPLGVLAGQLLCGYWLSAPTETIWPITIAVTMMYCGVALVGAVGGALFMSFASGTWSLVSCVGRRCQKPSDLS